MDLQVFGHFGNLVSRATTFMFWVFPNSKWNYLKKCHEVWKKCEILTLEKFSKCWKFWLFVDFSKFLDFLWSWWIIWSILMIEKVLSLKKLTKSQSLTFQCRWNFIRWSRNWLMKNVNFCVVLNHKIRSRCFIEDMKINLQAEKSFIDQKISDCLSSMKTLIGRSSIDHEKKLRSEDQRLMVAQDISI